MTRLEFRWDHDLNANGGGHFGGISGDTPRNNDYLLALNVIYKF